MAREKEKRNNKRERRNQNRAPKTTMAKHVQAEKKSLSILWTYIWPMSRVRPARPEPNRPCVYPPSVQARPNNGTGHAMPARRA
jgi:hypothetical protein